MHALTPRDVVTDEQVALVKQTIAKDATPAELKLFLYDCDRQGVHPLDQLIHFTKRGGRYVPITSIHFMEMRAASTGAYAGADNGVFAGEPGKPGFSCTVAVYRIVQGVRCAWSATAWWEEYYPGDGMSGSMWRKMPRVMLEKVATARALRKAFSDVLHGLYTKEEMAQAGGEKAQKDTRTLREKLGIAEASEDEVYSSTPLVESAPEELAPVYEPVEPGGEPLVLQHPDTFPIGKHAGQALDTVPTGYLRWAAEKMTHADGRRIAEAELLRRASLEIEDEVPSE